MMVIEALANFRNNVNPRPLCFRGTRWSELNVRTAKSPAKQIYLKKLFCLQLVLAEVFARRERAVCFAEAFCRVCSCQVL